MYNKHNTSSNELLNSTISRIENVCLFLNLVLCQSSNLSYHNRHNLFFSTINRNFRKKHIYMFLSVSMHYRSHQTIFDINESLMTLRGSVAIRQSVSPPPAGPIIRHPDSPTKMFFFHFHRSSKDI